MVLGPVDAGLGAANVILPQAAARPPRAPRRQLQDTLFDTCAGCSNVQVVNDSGANMSSIPQGALAVRAMAANNAKKTELGGSELAFEHPPLKYNSKLMNSIWGLYNRYSVHNFKKNTDWGNSSLNFGGQQQVPSAAAPLSGALPEYLCIQ